MTCYRISAPQNQAIVVPSGQATESLAGLDGQYCLETGYCRTPDSAAIAPPQSGLMFLAVGIVAFGVGRLVRHRAARPD